MLGYPTYEQLDSISVPNVGYLIWRCIKLDDITGEPSTECRERPSLPPTDTEGVSWRLNNVWGAKGPDNACDGDPDADPPMEPTPGYQWEQCMSKDSRLRAKPDTPSGARLIDIGDGYALFPYPWSVPDRKPYTWLSEVSGVTSLPGYAGVDDYILTDWSAYRQAVFNGLREHGDRQVEIHCYPQ